MSCTLPNKNAKDNLKHDLSFISEKGLDILPSFTSIKEVSAYNNNQLNFSEQAENIINKWNATLPLMDLKGTVAEVVMLETPHTTEDGVGVSKTASINYNDELLEQIDDYRKSIGIYDSKQSLYDYLNSVAQDAPMLPFHEEPTDNKETFAPIRKVSSTTPNAEEVNRQYEESVTAYTALISSVLANKPTVSFEGLVASLFNNSSFGSRKLDLHYEMLREAWNKAVEGMEKTEQKDMTDKKVMASEGKEIYEKYFVPEDSISSFGSISTPAVKEISTEAVTDKPVDTAVVENKPVVVENPVTKEEVVILDVAPHTKNLYSETGGKIEAMLGLAYEYNENKDYETNTNEANTSATPFLNYSNFYKGSEIPLTLNLNYLVDNNGENLVGVWMDLEEQYLTANSKRPKRLKIAAKEHLSNLFPDKTWEDIKKAIFDYQKNGFNENNKWMFDNKEFIKTVPIGVMNTNRQFSTDINSDIIAGGLPDYYWFNARNVALKGTTVGDVFIPDVEERQRRIAENRRINFENRRAVIQKGVHVVKIKERRRSVENRIDENKKGDQTRFNSISSQFPSVEEFDNNAKMAFFANNILYKEQGVPLFKTEDEAKQLIDNYADFIKQAKAEKFLNGRSVFLYKSGVKEVIVGGKKVLKDTYTIGNITNQHLKRQEEYQQLFENKKAFDNWYRTATKEDIDKVSSVLQKILIGEGDLTPPNILSSLKEILKDAFPTPTIISQGDRNAYEKEKAKAVERIEELKADTTISEERRNRRIAVEQNTIDRVNSLTSRDGYRQNYNGNVYHGHKPANSGVEYIKTIPDFSLISAEDLIRFALSGETDKIPTISVKNQILSNLHTNLIFTPVNKELSNGKIDKRYTSDAQPMIMFEAGSSNVTSEQVQEQEKSLNRLETQKATLEKDLQSLPEGLQKITKDKIANLESRIKEVAKDLKQKEEVLEKRKADKKPKKENPNEFTRRDYNILLQNIVSKTLSFVPLQDSVDVIALYRIAEDVALQMIVENKKKGNLEVADFIERNLFNLLGYNPETNQIYYENSVREYINAELDLNQNEADKIARALGDNLKNYESASFEVDPKDSLSARARLALVGISDTRLESGVAGLYPLLTSKYSFGIIQQALLNAKDNSFENLIAALKNKMSMNPNALGFYQKIIDRLEEINETNPDIITQIIYQLYQHPVDMKMVLINNKGGQLAFEILDANSKNPKILTRSEWTGLLKLNGLLDFYGGNKYTFNKEKLNILKEDYKELLASINEEDYSFFSDVSMEERIEMLENVFRPLGISLEPALLEKMANGDTINGYNPLKETVSGDQSILKYIFENIEKIETSDKKYSLDGQVPGAVTFNPILDNVSKIHDLINVNNAMKYTPNSTVRIAEKNINVSQQPNRITTEVKDIKQDVVESLKSGETTGEVKNILDTPSMKNSLLINMLLDNEEEAKNYFDVFNPSLEPFKERGAKSSKDEGVTRLSDLDRLFMELAFAFESEGSVRSEWFEGMYGDFFTFRKSYARFSTISDSSQLPYLKSFFINITDSHVDVDTGEMQSPLLDLLMDQLVSSDIRRIVDYILNVEAKGETSNDVYYDNGVKLFHNFPLLNSLIVDSSFDDSQKSLLAIELINRIRDEKDSLLTDEDIEDFINNFIENYSTDIIEEIEQTVKSNAQNVITALSEHTDENGNVKASFGKLKGKNTKLLAYDHTINTLLQQKEMQQIFAGDISYYFKSGTLSKANKSKNLISGIYPAINFLDVFNYYYGGNSKDVDKFNMITKDFNLDNITPAQAQILIQNFPKLTLAPEFSSETEVSKKYFNEELQEVYDHISATIFEEVRNNLSKRLKGLISPGNLHVFDNSTQEYTQIMVEDIENTSKNLIDYISLYHPEVLSNTKFMDSVERFIELDNEYKEDLTPEELKELDAIKKQIKSVAPKIYAYTETKSTDAQEYVTWKEQLDILKTRGRIDSDFYKLLFDKLQAQSDFSADTKNRLTPIPASLRLTTEEAALFDAQPTKPVYFGIVNTEAGYGHKMRRPVYVKSSAFPLLPEFTHGLPSENLNLLRNNLETYQKVSGKNVRVSYQSANKVGAIKKAIPINSLYTNFSSTEVLTKLLDSSAVSLQRKYLLTQQDVPFHHNHNLENNKVDTEGIKTQFEKIILGDGISEITEKVFDSEYFDDDILEDLGIEVENGKVSGVDLKNIYEELYRRQQKLKGENLLSELEIESLKDFENVSLTTLRKIRKLLISGLDRKQDIKALDIVHTTKDGRTLTEEEYVLLPKEEREGIKHSFAVPLVYSLNARKIESVLNSKIDSTFTNLTLPGHHFIVGSEEGTKVTAAEFVDNDLDALKAKGLVLTSNYDPTVGLKPNQVFMSNKVTAFNPKTNRIETVDFRQYMIPGTNTIDMEAVPKELVQMFSMRVPTSAHQSGALIEIAGFLPDSMRDLLLVSKDATVQIGEDYDIDHRYSYSFNLVKDINGEYRRMTYADLVSEENVANAFEIESQEISVLRKQYQKAKNKVWEQFKKEENDKEVFKNKYWEENKEILFKIKELKDILKNKNFHPGLLEGYELPDYKDEKELKDFIKEEIKTLETELIPPFIVKEETNRLKEEYYYLLEKIEEQYNSDKSEIFKEWNNIRSALQNVFVENKVLENNISGLYQSVFSTENEDVKKLIHRVLSTDFSENTAAIIDNKNKAAKKDAPRYNIYSYNTQNSVLKSGSMGKIGIGVHSNGVTFNSLLQQLVNKLKVDFIDYVYDKELKKVVPVIATKPRKFGKMSWDGVLGRTLKSLGKYTSIYIMESQNSATDNQKLEIMNRRNENTHTMNILLLMQMASLEEDGLQIKANAGDKIGKNYSYASLFISQPIIMEYVSAIEQIESKSGNDTRTKKDIIKALKEKYSIGENKVKTDKIMGTITSQKLFEMIGSKDEYKEEQLAILDRFLELQKISRGIGELQQFLSIESNGVGQTFMGVVQKMNTLISYFIGKDSGEIFENDYFLGKHNIRTENRNNIVKEMVGDFLVVDENVEVAEDYVYLKTENGQSYYIKPKTTYGQKLVHSIAYSYNLWKSQFPFDMDVFSNLITNLGKNLDIDLTNEDSSQEFIEKVTEALRMYNYADFQNSFGDNSENLSNRLFFNKEGNESLASYVLRLKNHKNEKGEYPYRELFELDLFKNLQFEINSEEYPSLLKYNGSKETKGENVLNYNQLVSLIDSDKPLLAKADGTVMTEGQLMKEMLIYSLIANQERGAIGFRNKLPIELFRKYNIDVNLRNNSDFKDTTFRSKLISIESYMSSILPPFDVDGIFKIEDVKYLSDYYYYVDTINNFAKSLGIKDNVLSIKGKTIHYNYSNKQTPGDFTLFYDDFVQHNANLVKEINLEAAGYNPQTGELIVYGLVNEDFLKHTTESGEILLFKRKPIPDFPNSTIYQQIPVYGSFGFSEYNKPLGKRESLIPTNNPELTPEENVSLISTETPADLEKIESEGLSVAKIFKDMGRDTNGRYYPLLEMLSPYIENMDDVEVIFVDKLKGAGSFDGKVIRLNKSYISQLNNKKDVENILIEEILHWVTRNALKDYVTIKNISSEGVEYELKKDKHASNGSIVKLMDIYSFAIKDYIERNGVENFNKKIEAFDPKKNSSKSLLVESEQDLSLYRLSDLHEFLAGLFLKDTTFAKEMAETEYKGENIIKSFVRALLKFINKVLPKTNYKSISAQSVEALMEILIVNRFDNMKSENTVKNVIKKLKFAESSLNLKNRKTVDMKDKKVEDITNISDKATSENVQVDEVAGRKSFSKESIKPKYVFKTKQEAAFEVEDKNIPTGTIIEIQEDDYNGLFKVHNPENDSIEFEKIIFDNSADNIENNAPKTKIFSNVKLNCR